mmetsp:Transcript_28372/g.57653  ORF Transcript_28372/g.57653 Transcript_28372/m.57653 type:complete len:80 (+) Transcript_28372:301-540(+)
MDGTWYRSCSEGHRLTTKRNIRRGNMMNTAVLSSRSTSPSDTRHTPMNKEHLPSLDAPVLQSNDDNVELLGVEHLEQSG